MVFLMHPAVESRVVLQSVERFHCNSEQKLLHGGVPVHIIEAELVNDGHDEHIDEETRESRQLVHRRDGVGVLFHVVTQHEEWGSDHPLIEETNLHGLKHSSVNSSLEKNSHRTYLDEFTHVERLVFAWLNLVLSRPFRSASQVHVDENRTDSPEGDLN